MFFLIIFTRDILLRLSISVEGKLEEEKVRKRAFKDNLAATNFARFDFLP